MWGTRLYRIYYHMRDRCYNPNSASYPYYGGRGIRIDAAWNTFEAFQSWAEESGYNDSLTIDRINVFGNYSPDNCRWITLREQQWNTTRSHTITIGNETRTIQGWADETAYPQKKLYCVLKTQERKIHNLTLNVLSLILNLMCLVIYGMVSFLQYKLFKEFGDSHYKKQSVLWGCLTICWVILAIIRIAAL